MMDQPRGTTAFLTSCQCNNGKNGIPELWGYNLLQGNNRLALSHQGFSDSLWWNPLRYKQLPKKVPMYGWHKKPSKLHLGYILKIESAKSCHFAKSPPIAKRKAKIGRKPPNTWWAWGSKHKFWICLHRRSLQNSTQWKNFESWSGGPTPHG